VLVVEYVTDWEDPPLQLVAEVGEVIERVPGVDEVMVNGAALVP